MILLRATKSFFFPDGNCASAGAFDIYGIKPVGIVRLMKGGLFFNNEKVL